MTTGPWAAMRSSTSPMPRLEDSERRYDRRGFSSPSIVMINAPGSLGVNRGTGFDHLRAHNVVHRFPVGGYVVGLRDLEHAKVAGIRRGCAPADRVQCLCCERVAVVIYGLREQSDLSVLEPVDAADRLLHNETGLLESWRLRPCSN